MASVQRRLQAQHTGASDAATASPMPAANSGDDASYRTMETRHASTAASPVSVRRKEGGGDGSGGEEEEGEGEWGGSVLPLWGGKMESELNTHHRQQQKHQQQHQQEHQQEQQQQQQQRQRLPFGGIASDQYPHSSAEFLRQNPFVNHKSINQFRSKSRVSDDDKIAIMREQQELEIAAGCNCVGDGCDSNEDDGDGDGDGGCD